MKPINAKRERGAALLALLAVIMLGASWLLVTQLNAESGGRSAVSRIRNAEVLNRAKLSLIGYVATKAAEAGETNPGRLSCPEPAGYIGGSNEGVAAGNCTLPAIGRFPWRTFGTDKLVDAAGEPLWYVVSPAWALSNSTTPALTTYINSNSTGQLLVNARSVSTLTQTAGLATAVSTAHGFSTGDIVKISGATPAGYNVAASVTVVNANTFTFAVDSALSSSATGTIMAGDSVVALIIAPGQAMTVATSANCTARTQARSVPAPAINALDYLECYDAANGVFSNTRSSSTFNDQVLTITAADVMPAIEAAIANRIEREIVPVLNWVYVPTTWGFAGSNPVLPFPAPFADPGTSNYQGAASTCVASVCKGLLPFFQTIGCTPTTDPRCTTTGGLPFFVFSKPVGYVDTKVSGGGSVRTTTLPNTSTCVWQSNVYVCTGEYNAPSISVSVSVNVTNISMGLRASDSTKVTCTAVDDAGGGIGVQPVTCSSSVALQSDGSAKLTVVTGALPDIVGSGWGTYANYKINIDRAAFGDHPVVSKDARILSFNAGIAEIQNGQTVTGSISAASGTAIVLKQSGNWGSDAAGLLFFSSVTNGPSDAPFRSGEALQVGGSTKATAAATDSDLGWFARNEWYRLVYYAVAQGHTAGTLPPVCATGTNCLSVANVTPANAQRAILILTGRSINGTARPSSTLANYLEFGNATATFERQPVSLSVAAALKKPFNDRIVVVGSN